ncbi:MAG TPA: rhomboid family intramembrane serine protease [Blastocatellia bacterium]|jgi:membrane associated rhomboid family serine protease|nr:rhomboid family intramembrane serine protease [Blastocatellia bacterium]HAF22869.1 rhomboid family intramembrane serine protease [Blastocatellia bacterium]HCX30314.1 rhomboid family intramembrane serine protease [Blastocatellia bacterium]
MVFPLYDDNSDRTLTPFVNYVLIAINIFVFVFLQQLGTNEKFTYAFSTVPLEIVSGRDIRTPDRVVEDPVGGQRLLVPGLQPTPFSVYLTLIFSMFMHGGIAHIAGNMLFLWIFGDNVEDRMGHFRYLIFYLVAGVLASLAHVIATAALATDQSSMLIPSLGASGAISGVLGGYIVLYPRRRVTVIMFRFLTDVPAYVAIGIWFAFQLISGLGILGGGSQQGGVAYAAHVGGFVAGLVLVKFFTIGRGSQSSDWSGRT